MSGLILTLYLATANCVGFPAGEEPRPPRIVIRPTHLVPCSGFNANDKCHGLYEPRQKKVVVTYETVDSTLGHEFLHHLLKARFDTYDRKHRRPEWARCSFRLGDVE